MFKHFILTRFNLKRLDGFTDHDKNNQSVLTEKWLEKRFFLFEKYCFPSIYKQTCESFIWFVMFSHDTPERFVKLIKDYESKFPLFKPLFLESGDHESVKATFNREMIKYLHDDDQYIITSRIDNDDAFHEDYIMEVQKLFEFQNDTFISFTYGLQYDIKRELLVRMQYMNNHFISRIEKITNGIDTVIVHDHTFINKVSEVIYVKKKNKPLWLEVIHENNIINKLYLESQPIFKNSVLRFFHFNANVSFLNTLSFSINHLKVMVLLLIRKIIKKRD